VKNLVGSFSFSILRVFPLRFLFRKFFIIIHRYPMMDNESIGGSRNRGVRSRCVTGMKSETLPTSQIGSITGKEDLSFS
jgi:hypothetical protein